MNNKICGLVYGQALGDAVGAYTEFRTRKTLDNEFKKKVILNSH